MVFNSSRRLALSTVAIVLVVTAGAFADEPAAPANAAGPVEEVSRLLALLDSNQRAERVRAEQRLLELGPVVLPLLPPPDLLPSAAVRSAVGRVRLELERRQAQASVAASRVKLAGTRPLEAWVDEISRQSGNRVDCAALPAEVRKQPITLDTAGAFWQVVDQLGEPRRLRYNLDESARELHLVAQAASDGVVAATFAGPFRVVVLSAEMRKNFADPAGRLLRIRLQLMPEPRLRTLFLQYAARDVTVSTAKGAVLESLNPASQYELPLGRAQSPAGVQLDYRVPAGFEATDLSIRGKVQVTTAAASERIAFTDLQTLAGGQPVDIARRRGGVTVRLKRVRYSEPSPGRRELRVRVTVEYDSGGPAFESHRTWMLHNRVFLEDSESRRIELNGGHEMTLQADGAVGLEYCFRDVPDMGRIAAFVYMAPTLIVDVPLEFTIQSCRVDPPLSNIQQGRSP